MMIAVTRMGALLIAGVLSTGQSTRTLERPVELPNQSLAMEADLDRGPNGWM